MCSITKFSAAFRVRGLCHLTGGQTALGLMSHCPLVAKAVVWRREFALLVQHCLPKFVTSVGFIRC